MISLKDKESNLYESQKVWHTCKEKFCYDKNKKIQYELYKSEIIATTPENLGELLKIFAI